MVRLQSALEYLTTYGWALLIILAAASALYYLIIATPAGESSCLLESGFSCTNIALATNGILTVTIQQATQTPINITAFGCNDNVTTTYLNYMQHPYNPPSNQIPVLIGGNYTFSVPCYSKGVLFAKSAGTTYTGYIVLNYTNQFTGFPHTIYGTITAKIS